MRRWSRPRMPRLVPPSGKTRKSSWPAKRNGKTTSHHVRFSGGDLRAV
jgi:hypothetical protein